MICHRQLGKAPPFPRYMVDESKLSETDLDDLRRSTEADAGGFVPVATNSILWDFKHHPAVVEMPTGMECLGSRCAMWVREHMTDGTTETPTGFGCCADNRAAVPWPDPGAPHEPASE